MDSTHFENWKRRDIFDVLSKENGTFSFDGSSSAINHNMSKYDSTALDLERACDSIKDNEMKSYGEKEFFYGENAHSRPVHSKDDSGEDIRHGIKAIWQRFAAGTTLHGAVFIQQTNFNVIGRVTWCVLVLGMLGSLSYVLIDLLLKYREYPFTSVWSLRRQATIDAPTITMCPVNGLDVAKIKGSSEVVQNYYNTTWWEGRDKEELKQFNMTQSSMLADHGFSKHQLILWASFGKALETTLEGTSFITKREIDDRLCFTFNDFRDEVQIGKITDEHTLTVFFKLQRDNLFNFVRHLGIFLYIHKKGTSISRTQPIMVSSGLAYYVKFEQTDYTFLPLPYKSFENLGCVDVADPDFTNDLLKYPIYTRENCLDELIQHVSANYCGCVDISYTELLGFRECTLYEWLTCVKSTSSYITQNLTESNSFAGFMCRHACNDTVLKASPSTLMYDPKLSANSTYKEQDYIHLIVQPKSTNVETVKHEPELTLVEILAVVGGYMGLFLGASLLTAAEFIQVLMLSLKHLLWDKRKKTKQNYAER